MWVRYNQDTLRRPTHHWIPPQELEEWFKDNFPLYDYAARYWVHHVRNAGSLISPNAQDFCEAAKAFLTMPWAAYQAHAWIHEGGMGEVDGPMAQEPQLAVDGYRNFGTHLIAQTGSAELMSFLINAGIYSGVAVPAGGLTPLYRALRSDFSDAVATLVESGQVSLRDGSLGGSMPPLAYAVWHGSTKAVQYMISTGLADINGKGKDGHTPLQTATNAYVIKPEGNALKIAEMLLCADSVDKNATDKWGRTALHLAVTRDSESLISLLVRYGLDPNAADNEGETPMTFAIWGGHQGIISILKNGRVTAKQDRNDDGGEQHVEEQGSRLDLLSREERESSHVRS